MTKKLGIYIHIPFCVSKCTYCSFYSSPADEAQKDRYCEKLIKELKKWGAEVSRPISSVYIGGGTPTALGGERLYKILNAVNKNFSVLPDAEITVEGNPADNYGEIAPFLKKGGCNRFSLGVQSANEAELSVLGRRHINRDVINAVSVLKENGIHNISADLMLGLPDSTKKTLKNSIDFVLSLGITHISAYILKLEEGTKLEAIANTLNIPDDDSVCEQYLFLSSELQNAGYEHYEISNFAKSGFHSRHNSSYWELGEYLGFGPSAHSFYKGKRFYYKNDLAEYIASPCPIADGEGGNEEEYIMLGLRLKSGISNADFAARFGKELPKSIFEKAKKLQENGLCDIIDNSISLTDKGMLVSNTVINYFSQSI